MYLWLEDVLIQGESRLVGVPMRRGQEVHPFQQRFFGPTNHLVVAVCGRAIYTDSVAATLFFLNGIPKTVKGHGG